VADWFNNKDVILHWKTKHYLPRLTLLREEAGD